MHSSALERTLRVYLIVRTIVTLWRFNRIETMLLHDQYSGVRGRRISIRQHLCIEHNCAASAQCMCIQVCDVHMAYQGCIACGLTLHE